MPESPKPGATVPGSPTGEPGGAKPGDSPPPEELKAELERKTKELDKAKSDHKSAMDKVAELERQREEEGLSKDEEDELLAEREKVRATADKIRRTKEFAPFELLFKEQARDAAMEVELNADTIRANHYCEDWSIDEGFFKDGVSIKEAAEKMAKAIAPFARQFDDEMPSRRNQLAYRAWKADQKRLSGLDDREKTLKEREDKAMRFREGSPERVARDESALQKIGKARTADEKSAAMKDLVGTAQGQ